MTHADVPADLDASAVRRAIVARAAALLRIQGPVPDLGDQTVTAEGAAGLRIAGHRLDSLDLVELVVTLEDELNVAIAGESAADGGIASLTTLCDVLMRGTAPAILDDFCRIWLASAERPETPI